MLDKEEQFTLLERIVALIRKNDTHNTPTKLSKISGIGAKVGKHTNIENILPGKTMVIED